MNKQELLDEAVHTMEGVWENARPCVNNWEDKTLVILGRISGGKAIYQTVPNALYNGDYVCEKHEFQQRAIELGYGAEDWYDYTNQKALRLPPVGVECEAFLMDASYKNAWFKVEILKNHLDRECACMRIENRGLTWCNTFRPFDHNRKAEAERKRCIEAVRDAYFGFGGDSYASFAMLYDAGFLRMPDDK